MPKILEKAKKGANTKPLEKGYLYEYQVLLFFLLNAKLNGFCNYRVGCSLKGFGKLDDFIIEYDEDQETKQICVQIKHKENVADWLLDLDLLNGIKLKRITAKRKESAFKIFKDYKSLEGCLQCNKCLIPAQPIALCKKCSKKKVQTDLDEQSKVPLLQSVEYVYFTNIKSDNSSTKTTDNTAGCSKNTVQYKSVKWKQDPVYPNKLCILNTTGSSVLKIDTTSTHNINNLEIPAEKLVDMKNYLQNVSFLTEQANTEAIKDKIKDTITSLLQPKCDSTDADLMYISLLNQLRETKKVTLTENDFNDFFDVAKEWANYLILSKRNELKFNECRFQSNILGEIANNKESICFTTEDKCTLLAIFKIYQSFIGKNCKHLIVRAEDLGEVMQLFECKKDWIIVDCDKDAKAYIENIEKLIKLLEKYKETKAIFLLLKTDSNISCLQKLSHIPLNYSFEDFDENTQKRLLGTNVILQGCQVTLLDILQEDHVKNSQEDAKKLVDDTEIKKDKERVTEGEDNEYTMEIQEAAKKLVDDTEIKKDKERVTEGEDNEYTMEIQEAAKKLVDYETVLKLLKDKEIVTVGEDLKKLVESMKNVYLNRNLMLREIKKEALEKLKNTDIFFVTGESLQKLQYSSTNYEPCKEIHLEDKNVILYECTDKTEVNKAYLKLLENKVIKKKNLHLLEFKMNKLVWRQSTGNIEVLKNYVEHDIEGYCESEDIFIEQTQNFVNIISDKPGMGKTTVLKKISWLLKEKYKTTPVYFKDLNSDPVVNMFNLYKVGITDPLLLFKTDFKELEPELHKKILEYSFIKGRIFFLFDGFDELNTFTANLFLAFVQDLIKRSNGHIQVWITSRQSMQEELEKTFCTFAVKMMPFNEANQIEFLKNHHVTQENKNKSEQKVDKQSELYAKILNISKHIRNVLGLPLLLNMIATIYDDQLSVNLEVPFKNVTELYDQFINSYMERHISSKEGTNKNNVAYKLKKKLKKIPQEYGVIALKSLCLQIGSDFTEEEDKIYHEQLQTEKKEKVVKVGIIYDLSENEQKFLHLTYAEYFVAKYVHESLESISELSTEKKQITMKRLGCILLNTKNAMIRKFLENYSYSKCNITKTTVPDVHSFLGDVDVLKNSMNENNEKIFRFIVKAIFSEFDEETDFDSKSYINSEFFFSKPLTYAAINGQSDVVCLLLKNHANINDIDLNGMTALIHASIAGESKIVSILLSHGADVTMKDNKEYSALMYAAINGQSDVVCLLLKNHANINDIDLNGMTALIHASIAGESKIVSILLYRGADVTMKDNKEYSALRYAVKKGSSFIVSMLIDFGAKINENYTDIKSEKTYFSNKVTGIYDIWPEGPDKNSKSYKGMSVLMYAAWSGNCDVVGTLLNRGAHITDTDNNGWTALMYAASKGHSLVVSLLVDYDENTSYKDHTGTTALMYAAFEGHSNVVSLLIVRGAEINVKNNEDMTALTHASKAGHCDVVSLLLDSGASINDKNILGMTALMYAERLKHYDVVALLLNHCTDKTLMENKCTTALMHAAALGNYELTCLLLAKKADIFVKDNDGLTAFMHAINNNHTEVASLLKEHGAN